LIRQTPDQVRFYEKAFHLQPVANLKDDDILISFSSTTGWNKTGNRCRIRVSTAHSAASTQCHQVMKIFGGEVQKRRVNDPALK
jgi:hypothetical protein